MIGKGVPGFIVSRIPFHTIADSLMRLLCEYGGAEMEMLQSTLEALIKQQSLTESQIAHITDVVREVLESSTEMNVELLLARITPLLQGNDTETNSQAATKPDDLESTPRTENLQGKDTKSKWDVSQPVGSMHMASIPAAGQSSVPYLTAGSQAATVLTQPLPQPSAPSHELTNLFGKCNLFNSLRPGWNAGRFQNI